MATLLGIVRKKRNAVSRSGRRFLWRSASTVFFALLLCAGCDTGAPPDDDPTVSPAVRHLDPGQFSLDVEGRSDIETELSGEARYGFFEEEGDRQFGMLFTDDDDPARFVLFTAPAQERSPGQRRIGDAVEEAGEDVFRSFYSADARTYHSLSGQMTLYDLRDEDGEDERGGQFYMATEDDSDSSRAAQLIGSFRALPADDFGQLMERRRTGE